MITGDDIPGNANTSSLNITMNIGWFLLIIFLLVGIAIFIAFICYHAKDKKIERYKKVLKNSLTEKELKLLTDYRNLNNKNKQIVEDTVKDLVADNNNSNDLSLSK